MKAQGVDRTSKFRLIKLADEGYTAEEISSMIQVEEKSVKGWMKHLGYPKKVETEEPVKVVKKAKTTKKDKTEED